MGRYVEDDYNVQLELVTDIDMFQFIEKGMCGVISYIANRHGEANNKYMTGYNPPKPSKYIMYANNLYGWAMSQCLATEGFKWLSQKNIEKINLVTCTGDGKKGMIMEVYLEYPSSLRKLHNDYPLAVENMRVNKDMLSPYGEMIRDKYGIGIGQVSKLIPTLVKKEKHVLHYSNLQP